MGANESFHEDVDEETLSTFRERQDPVKTRSIRILCYGDSLTAGFYDGGNKFSPYAKQLMETLASLGYVTHIHVCGLSGHCATEMVAEANAAVTKTDICGKVGKGLARTLDEDGPFDLAILMAGTNDFGRHDVPSTQRAVRQLHKFCHSRGVPTVLMHAPSSSQNVRIACLMGLQEWSRKSDKVAALADPEAIIPRKYGAYWESDRVHFSPAGSRALGVGLAPTIAKVLEALGHCPESGAKAAPSVRSLTRADASLVRQNTFVVPRSCGQQSRVVGQRSRKIMPVRMPKGVNVSFQRPLFVDL